MKHCFVKADSLFGLMENFREKGVEANCYLNIENCGTEETFGISAYI